MVWKVRSLEAGDLGHGNRSLYYVLEDEEGGKAEMTVVLRDSEVQSVLLTTSRGDYMLSGTNAEMFLRFVEAELLRAKLPESPVQEE
jgi:hypothetical protein